MEVVQRHEVTDAAFSMNVADENPNEMATVAMITVETLLPYKVVWTREVMFRVITICVVMFLTVIGNVALIISISCYPRQRRKRVNLFLLNLAVGDLLVCFVTMTTEIIFVAFGEWVLGSVACKLVVYMQMVTLSSATFLLTGMSIDRYQVLVQPLRSLAGRPTIWRKVALAWLAAFTFASPQLAIFLQKDVGVYPDGRHKYQCVSQGYTAAWQRKAYFTFLTTYVLVIPAIIMTFCYTNIIRVVWTRSESSSARPRVGLRFTSSKRNFSIPAQNNTGLRIPKKLLTSSKRKVVKMTLSVIIGFLICWTPYFVVSLVRIYSNYTIKLRTGLSIAEVMALIHSALNPILYGLFSSKLSVMTLVRILRCQYPSSILDRMEDATSETESTWADYRRHSGAPSAKNVQKCLGCFRTETKQHVSSPHECVYTELVPNGKAVMTEQLSDSDSDRSPNHRPNGRLHYPRNAQLCGELRSGDPQAMYTALVYQNRYIPVHEERVSAV